MEKLFETVYNETQNHLQECHFKEVKLVKAAEKISKELKEKFNKQWIRGIHFIESIDYNNLEHSWTIHWKDRFGCPQDFKEMLSEQLKLIESEPWRTDMHIDGELLDNKTCKIYIPVPKDI